MISSVEPCTSQGGLIIKGELKDTGNATTTGLQKTVMKESIARFPGRGEGSRPSTERREIVDGKTNMKKYSEQKSEIKNDEAQRLSCISDMDLMLSDDKTTNVDVVSDDKTTNVDVVVATVNGYVAGKSSSMGDVFRNHQSVLGSTAFTKTTKLDRLLATEPRMSSLRKHLSLSMTSTPSSGANRSSPGRSDFKWLSSANNNAIKSPTFSMADITVIVPPKVEAEEAYDEKVFPKTECLNDSITENIGIAKESRQPAKQQNTHSVNVGPMPRNTFVPPNEKVRSLIDTEVNTSEAKNEGLSTVCSHQAQANHDPIISKDNSHPIISKDNSPCTGFDLNQLISSSHQALSDHTECSNRRPSSLASSEDVAKNKQCQSFVCSKKNAIDEKNYGSKENSLLLTDVDVDQENLAEWKYVGSTRSKQKRRQCQTSKLTTLPQATNSSLNRSFNKNISSPKKLTNSEKPNLRSKFPNQSTLSSPSGSEQLESQSKSSRTAIATTEKRASTAVANKNDSIRSADIMQVPAANGGGYKSEADTNTKFKDNANSLDLEADQSCLQTSSSIVDHHSVQNNTVAVPDREKMSVGENNSNAADLNNHPSEEAINAVSKLELAEKEVDIVKGQVEEIKENNGSDEAFIQSTPTTPNLSPEELQRQLKNQLEYYFSRENLAQDPYLVSQMNPEQFVSIYTIANFNAIKKLTTDINQVVEALKASRLVEVDVKEEMVRPNPNRCAVILREIPESVKQEEVAALFTNCPAKFTSCEYAGNTNWYVYFDSENDAQSAYLYLRESVREFQGKPILLQDQWEPVVTTSVDFEKIIFALDPCFNSSSARFKSKTHHLNTYSYQSVSASMQEHKEHPANAHEVPQASQPMDFIPPLVTFPPSPFPSPHPSNQVAAIPTSLIARVAAPSPAVPVPSSGQGPPAAMAVNPHFNSIVVSPWPPGFYPPDAQVMASHLPGQFFPPTFKAAQMPHYTQSPVSGGKPLNNSSGHRFTDFHKGVASQRNTYNQQRKSSNSTYNQQHNSNSASKSRYVLTTDPNPPHLVSEVLGHYVQSEQGPTHVTHTMAAPHPTGHYLPAVTAPFAARAPFVTPTANDPNIVLVSQAHIMPPPPTGNQRPGSRRVHGQSYSGYRSTNYPHTEQMYPAVGSANGQRSRHSHSSRSNNYHSEISPRFIQKGGYGFHHPGYGAIPSGHYSDNSDIKPSYSHRTNNSNSNAQRQRNSPNADNHSAESNKQQGSAGSKGHYSDVSNSDENNNKRASQASNNSAAEQKNSHQSALEQRRNSRQRRTRKNDDERNPSIPAPPPPPLNATFNLESNSFPPLPGATESDAAVSANQDADARTVTSDTNKDADIVKSTPAETTAPPSVPPKKYSEVSSASLVTRCQVVHSKPAAEETKTIKKAEVKVSSAVNTQPVADKHPPVVNKRPVSSKQVSNEKKQVSEASKPASRPRASSSSTGNPVPNPGRKLTRNPSIQRESIKSAPAPKTDASTKTEANKESSSRHSSDSSEVKTGPKDDSSQEDKELSGDGSDRKPTYAEVMKAKQVNGKAMSDSGKSDSGDDNHSAEEAKDSEAKSVEPEKGSKPPGKPEKDGEPNKSDRKGGAVNGPSRRNDYDYRWHGRQYRDRNSDYRGNRGRDRHFNGERGNWEHRGRGGGFRGRRPGYRGYYGNGGGRSGPNSQNTNTNDR